MRIHAYIPFNQTANLRCICWLACGLMASGQCAFGCIRRNMLHPCDQRTSLHFKYFFSVIFCGSTERIRCTCTGWDWCQSAMHNIDKKCIRCRTELPNVSTGTSNIGRKIKTNWNTDSWCVRYTQRWMNYYRYRIVDAQVTAESKCHMSQHATNVLRPTRNRKFRFARFNGEPNGNHDFCFFNVCTIGVMEQSNKNMPELKWITMDFQKLRNSSEFCMASQRPTAGSCTRICIHFFCVVYHPMEWQMAQSADNTSKRKQQYLLYGCRHRYFHFSPNSIRFNIQWKWEYLCTKCCFHNQMCILFSHSTRTEKTAFEMTTWFAPEKKYRWRI